jgi:hypothetical protein
MSENLIYLPLKIILIGLDLLVRNDDIAKVLIHNRKSLLDEAKLTPALLYFSFIFNIIVVHCIR